MLKKLQKNQPRPSSSTVGLCESIWMTNWRQANRGRGNKGHKRRFLILGRKGDSIFLWPPNHRWAFQILNPVTSISWSSCFKLWAFLNLRPGLNAFNCNDENARSLYVHTKNGRKSHHAAADSGDWEGTLSHWETFFPQTGQVSLSQHCFQQQNGKGKMTP